MIVQRDQFSFSEYFYALDLNSFKPTYGLNGEVKAIWFKKTRGQIAVCMGNLTARATSLDELIQNHDGRYGGNTEYKWNGVEMWSGDNKFVELMAAHKILDPILKNFPNVPAGYTGWYSIKG